LARQFILAPFQVFIVDSAAASSVAKPDLKDRFMTFFSSVSKSGSNIETFGGTRL
jgi:hypothetical protein